MGRGKGYLYIFCKKEYTIPYGVKFQHRLSTMHVLLSEWSDKSNWCCCWWENEIRRKTHKINTKSRVSILLRLVTSLFSFLIIFDPLPQGIKFILSSKQLPLPPSEQPRVSNTKSSVTYFFHKLCIVHTLAQSPMLV